MFIYCDTALSDRLWGQYNMVFMVDTIVRYMCIYSIIWTMYGKCIDNRLAQNKLVIVDWFKIHC